MSAVGAAVILAMTACGSDEPESVDAATPTDTAAEQAAADAEDRAVEVDEVPETSSSHEDGSVAEHDDPEVPEPHDETGHDDESVEPVDAAAPDDDVDLVIPVVMLEFGYEMPEVDVPAGATVRFDFVNDGAIVHEAMLGDAHQQDEFAAEGGHDGGHGEADHHGEVLAITLDAGESGSLVVTFDEPGEMMIGCHIPGHWDAGMSATFTVS